MLTPRFDGARLRRAFSVLDDHVASGRLPAAVLAIGSPEGIIEARGFGSEGGRPIGTGHRFPVASVSKPVVAAAVLQLIEGGRLTLEEPVHAVLSEFDPRPTDGAPFGGPLPTPWHLLTHTSGVTDVEWDAGVDARPARDGLLRGACTRPLAFVPGTAYQYASDTFMLLGEIVRRIDGTQSFTDSLTSRVLGPLGMKATSFRTTQSGTPSVVPHHSGLSDEVALGLARWRESVEHPGGGLWSVAEDLVTFGRMFLNDGSVDGVRVLAQPFTVLMTTDQTKGLLEARDAPRRPRYALGWGKSALDGRLPGSPAQVDHFGTSGSRLWVDPGYGLVIALLAGLWGTDTRVSDTVVAAVYSALDT